MRGHFLIREKQRLSETAYFTQSAMSGMAERMRINNADHLDSQTIGQIKLRYHILGIHRDTEI